MVLKRLKGTKRGGWPGNVGSRKAPRRSIFAVLSQQARSTPAQPIHQKMSKRPGKPGVPAELALVASDLVDPTGPSRHILVNLADGMERNMPSRENHVTTR